MLSEQDFREFDEWAIYDLAFPGESEDAISSRLEWDGMDEVPDDAENIPWQHRGSAALPEDPAMGDMAELRDLLLEYGGNSVCFPAPDEDLWKIIERGILWDGADAAMMPGRPSQCHLNSARCWDANRDKTTIATGYSLSYDGIWRQHSWCVGFDDDDCPYIVETTDPRVAYYGFPMTYQECELFLYEND